MSSESIGVGTSSVLHVIELDKFIPPFIDFVEQHSADFSRHLFFIMGDEVRYPVRALRNNHFASLFGGFGRWTKLAQEMNRADKILLHGLFNRQVMLTLLFQPWVLKKCYWIIWGGDLYSYLSANKLRPREWIRKIVIPRLGHLVTHVRGDYDLARQWYGAKGRWHDCFMYPSNLYSDSPITPKPHHGTNILVGNSATPSNNHMDVLEKLRPFAGENIRIYCPLSYGDAAYGDGVAEAGKDMFGDKFIPLREFMSFEKYLDLLTEIDIAVYNHSRQQGMGNITTLLGLGKTVYMRKDLTSSAFFSSLGVEYGDIANLSPALSINCLSVSRNREIIRSYFSPETLISQMKALFQ